MERLKLPTIQTGHGTRTDSPSIGRGRLLTTVVAIKSMMNVVTAATVGKPRNTESLRAESVIGATLPNELRHRRENHEQRTIPRRRQYARAGYLKRLVVRHVSASTFWSLFCLRSYRASIHAAILPQTKLKSHATRTPHTRPPVPPTTARVATLQ